MSTNPMQPAPQNTAIIARLAKAVIEMQSPKANKTNPHFRSRYASLDHILDFVRPVLAKQGLGLVQYYGTTADGRRALSTMIVGPEGALVLGDPFPLPMKDDAAQSMMSASTSTRRMAVQAAFGISTDQDDDGAAASSQPAAKKWVPNPTAAVPAPTSKPMSL